MQPEASVTCKVIEERYDEADLALLVAWRPDIDALLEAIVSTPVPTILSCDADAREDWAAFVSLAADIQRTRHDVQ